MATFYTNTGSFENLIVSGATGGTLLSISGSQGSILNISDGASSTLFSVSTGSETILGITTDKTITISGSLITTGSVTFKGVTESNTATRVLLSDSNGQLYYTASSAIGGGGTGTGFPFNGSALITGSLLISGSGLTITGSLNATSITGSLFGTASWAYSSSNAINSQTASYVLASNIVGSLSRIATGSISASVNVVTSSIFQLTSGSNTILNISNTGNTTLIGSGSTNPILAISGSQGDLFSVTDSLSGSLFAVNDINGLPVLEVFSDSTVLMGNYNASALYTTVTTAINTGTGQIIYQIPTASYWSAFYDYSVKSGSVGRTGNIMAMWSGSSVNFTETSASSFGITTGFTFGVIVTGSNMALTGSSTSGDGWIVRTIIRAI